MARQNKAIFLTLDSLVTAPTKDALSKINTTSLSALRSYAHASYKIVALFNPAMHGLSFDTREEETDAANALMRAIENHRFPRFADVLIVKCDNEAILQKYMRENNIDPMQSVVVDDTDAYNNLNACRNFKITKSDEFKKISLLAILAYRIRSKVPYFA